MIRQHTHWIWIEYRHCGTSTFVSWKEHWEKNIKIGKLKLHNACAEECHHSILMNGKMIFFSEKSTEIRRRVKHEFLISSMQNKKLIRYRKTKVAAEIERNFRVFPRIFHAKFLVIFFFLLSSEASGCRVDELIFFPPSKDETENRFFINRQYLFLLFSVKAASFHGN